MRKPLKKTLSIGGYPKRLGTIREKGGVELRRSSGRRKEVHERISKGNHLPRGEEER